MPRLSVQRLFDERRARLGLAWAAAPAGGQREFTGEMIHRPGVGLIGHLNLIHPLLAQVLGPREVEYLVKLDPAVRAQTCAHIAGGDTVCVLVGDGTVRTELEEQARRLGLSDRTSFPGIVPRSEIPAYVSAFDVALQPHVVAYASPLKLFEYLALGRAVIAPSTPNIREILDDGENGLLFDPADDASFRAALLRLIKDAGLRGRLGAGARATIDRRGLTWRHNAERVTQIAEQLLARRATGAIGARAGARS